MSLFLNNSPSIELMDEGICNWWTPGYSYTEFQIIWSNRHRRAAISGRGWDGVVRANWHLPRNWMIVPI